MQVGPLERMETRPETGEGRCGILRLHAAETLDGGNRAFARSLEEHLPRQCGAIELPAGQDLDLLSPVCRFFDRRAVPRRLT